MGKEGEQQVAVAPGKDGKSRERMKEMDEERVGSKEGGAAGGGVH
jgi:hypothetical protein